MSLETFRANLRIGDEILYAPNRNAHPDVQIDLFGNPLNKKGIKGEVVGEAGKGKHTFIKLEGEAAPKFVHTTTLFPTEKVVNQTSQFDQNQKAFQAFLF